jgi:hypothetical protein
MGAVREKKPEYGPAMRALNPRQRKFVDALLTGKPGYGALVNAAIKAGYRSKNPKTLTKAAYVLVRRESVSLALLEHGKKIIRGSGFAEAISATMNLVRDPKHPAHAKALGMIFDRCDPVRTFHQVDVEHHVQLDPDAEALAQDRACVAIGASQEKLKQLFGFSGLMRLAQRDRAESERDGTAPKMIEAVAIEETAHVEG